MQLVDDRLQVGAAPGRQHGDPEDRLLARRGMPFVGAHHETPCSVTFSGPATTLPSSNTCSPPAASSSRARATRLPRDHQHVADAHVEGGEHLHLGDAAQLLDGPEQRRDLSIRRSGAARDSPSGTTREKLPIMPPPVMCAIDLTGTPSSSSRRTLLT